MGWVGVVYLESGGQGALGKRVRVVTEESVVIAEQGVVDCVVAVRDEQVLMLRDDLMAKTNTLVSSLSIRPASFSSSGQYQNAVYSYTCTSRFF